MQPLFTHAQASQKTMAASQVQFSISQCEGKSLTGIVEVRREPDTQLVLLFVEGLILDTYRLEAEAREKIAPSQVSELLSGQTVTVRTLALPLEAVRVAKVLLDWHPPIETIPVAQGMVQTQLTTLSQHPSTHVVHLSWPNAEGLVILPGGVLPTGAIFITGTQLLGDSEGLAAIYAYGGENGTLARYEARVDVAALHEQSGRVRTAFALLVEPIIWRYTDLLGQGMGGALIMDINREASKNGWHIKVTTNGVADTHMFEAPEAAAQAYALLIQRLTKHATTMIGARLANTIISEVIDRLEPQVQQTLNAYRMVLAAELPGQSRR